MKWSKLRALVKERFAASLGSRIDLHTTRYGNCSCGHAWITLDGAVIANFCTRAKFIADGLERGSSSPNPMYGHQLAAFGEFSRQDAYRACWAFVHELSIDEAVADADPLVQSLAMLDSRLGKRRLRGIDPVLLHPLAAGMLTVRLQAEGLPFDSGYLAGPVEREALSAVG